MQKLINNKLIIIFGILFFLIPALLFAFNIQNWDDSIEKTEKETFGVERIPDKMLLTEMLQYFPGLNVDRLVAFAALVAFAKIQQGNRGYIKRKERDKSLEPLDISQNFGKLNKNPFRNIGRNKKIGGNKIIKNPFKNIR